MCITFVGGRRTTTQTEEERRQHHHKEAAEEESSTAQKEGEEESCAHSEGGGKAAPPHKERKNEREKSNISPQVTQLIWVVLRSPPLLGRWCFGTTKVLEKTANKQSKITVSILEDNSGVFFFPATTSNCVVALELPRLVVPDVPHHFIHVRDMLLLADSNHSVKIG